MGTKVRGPACSERVAVKAVKEGGWRWSRNSVVVRDWGSDAFTMIRARGRLKNTIDFSRAGCSMNYYTLAITVWLLFAFVLPGPASGQEERPVQPTDLNVALILMKVASAAETAPLLDEMYNGFGMARKARVGAYAIPGTNYLFLMGTSVDLLTIRSLIRP